MHLYSWRTSPGISQSLILPGNHVLDIDTSGVPLAKIVREAARAHAVASGKKGVLAITGKKSQVERIDMCLARKTHVIRWISGALGWQAPEDKPSHIAVLRTSLVDVSSH